MGNWKLKTTKTELEEDILEILTSTIFQACYSDGLLDSMGISTYADGILTLAEYGKVEIIKNKGRRVIAKLKMI